MGATEISYLGAFVGGLLSFLSPCVLPIVPPYLCFLGGVTLDEMVKKDQDVHVSDHRVFRAALFF